jgi:hypothetical protein
MRTTRHPLAHAPRALRAAALLVLCSPLLAGAEGPFQTSDRCLACHNGLATPSGADVSIGLDWRPSAMANSARDPYWRAAVRREVLDHPGAQAAIEDECTICHMPQATHEARLRGAKGVAFAHLAAPPATPAAAAAQDGVSCSVCHQITADGLGDRRSFNGRFAIAPAPAAGRRVAFGPREVRAGLARVMRSSSGFEPSTATHLRRSEVCASCHTLFTHALGPDGKPVGELPEQVPFLEWAHSAYRTEASCQSCHMPRAPEPAPIASVLGEPRAGLARHLFEGANFVLPRLLARARVEDRVPALATELDGAARRTIEHLQREAARVVVSRAQASGGELELEVAVENRAGHKLPTAYPSRRAWLHVLVRDAAGVVRFESGALRPDGRVVGNDNDDDPARFEPHHDQITRPDQVQVYEAIMGDPQGRVTTGLLTAVRYLKDNRLLPRGFAKGSAPADIAVRGDAAGDADFVAAGDRVRYRVPLAGATGPLQVTVELWYQPIGYRWAHNLGARPAPETDQFVRRFAALGPASATLVASARTTVTP